MTNDVSIASELNCPGDATFQQSAKTSVDVFDLTAHLEAQGIGLAAAKSRGFDDQFVQAEVAFAQYGNQHAHTVTDNASLNVVYRLIAALGRTLSIICGVLVCLATVHDASVQTIIVSGALGWMTGQAVSAAAWHGMSSGKIDNAARNLVTSTLIIVPLAAAFSLWANAGVAMLWVVWSIASATLMVLRPGRRSVLTTVALGVVASLALLTTPHIALWVALICIVVITSEAVQLIVNVLSGHTWVAFTTPLIVAAATAMAQAACQIGLLLLVLDIVGPSAAPAISISGLIAGAVADPVLEVAIMRVSSLTSKLASWSRGIWGTGAVGVLAVLATGGIAAVASVVVTVLWFSYLSMDVVVGSVIIGTSVAATGALLRVGLAVQALTLASIVSVVSLVLWTATGDLSTVTRLAAIAVVATTLSTVWAARALARPASWVV